VDIRTKLAIALVSVAILSMAALGFFAYQASAEFLQDISERQLDALAQSRSSDVQNVIESWRDGVRLIASRTQLRLNLNSYNTNASDQLLNSIRRIVSDAQASTPSVAALALYQTNGNRLVVSGNATLLDDHRQGTPDAIEYIGLVESDDQLFIRFHAPLQLENVNIGTLEIAFTTSELDAVISDYTGLGESGETIIIRQDDQGLISVLGQLRHSTERIQLSETNNDFIRAAIEGEDRIYTTNQLGYRGLNVWAATRYIPDVDWGLIVQVDQAEELVPVISFRDSLIDLGLALSAFAIFGGTLLGMYLARPVRQLAETVKRVGEGATDLRANENSEDEVGLVARAFNEFLDKENTGSSKDKPDN
jgi:HAMP domain-containing protein